MSRKKWYWLTVYIPRPQRPRFLDGVTHTDFKCSLSVSTAVAPNFLQPTRPYFARYFNMSAMFSTSQNELSTFSRKPGFASMVQTLSLLWFLSLSGHPLPHSRWRQCLHCFTPSVSFLVKPEFSQSRANWIHHEDKKGQAPLCPLFWFYLLNFKLLLSTSYRSNQDKITLLSSKRCQFPWGEVKL